MCDNIISEYQNKKKLIEKEILNIKSKPTKNKKIDFLKTVSLEKLESIKLVQDPSTLTQEDLFIYTRYQNRLKQISNLRRGNLDPKQINQIKT